jgi:cytochrome o ubiquinol oxidase subunit IV
MSERISTAEYKRTLNKYVSGFVLSIALTMASYLLVQAHLGSGKQVLAQPTILIAILVFAVAQLAVQLIFFLHLAEEHRPRWRLLLFALAVVFVLILVIGSIWIMANLGYHSPASQHQINNYLHSQGDL